MATTETLADVVRRAQARFEHRKDLANALDIDAGHLGRMLNGQTRTTSIETCLKLTPLAGGSGSAVLRAGGNGRWADLIESLFGSSRVVAPLRPLSSDEERCLALWRRLTARERRLLTAVIEAVVVPEKKSA